MSSSLFLFAAISLALFFSQSQADLIRTVCSKSRNPPVCNWVLRSDPRSRGSDLTGLGEIAIEKAQAAVKVATAAVKTVRPKGSRIKGVVSTCLETFSDAVDDLNDSKQFLKSRDKQSLNVHASAALDNVDTCDDEFNTAGGEPAIVARATKKAGDVIDVVLVISNL